jgi:hypothetical protein
MAPLYSSVIPTGPTVPWAWAAIPGTAPMSSRKGPYAKLRKRLSKTEVL